MPERFLANVGVQSASRVLIILALLFAAAQTRADTPLGKHWIPVFELSDEFNAESVDPAKWETTNRYYSGKKPGFYSERNARTNAGHLELWARAESDGKAPAGYRGYTVAYVASKRHMRYGYVEVRAKSISARIDCSFWLYRWTESGTYEIDVFEIGAGAPGHEHSVHTNLHYYLGDPEKESDQNRRSAPFAFKASHPLARDFHVFGLEWDPLELRFFFDDKLIRSVPNTHFHHPMSLRFATETQADWFGLPRPGELPGVFLIDYIRVWRDAGQPIEMPGPLPQRPAAR